MIFMSEQVSCGHPDKICDQISDAIVTACLSHDRNSRAAFCEDRSFCQSLSKGRKWQVKGEKYVMQKVSPGCP